MAGQSLSDFCGTSKKKAPPKRFTAARPRPKKA